MPRMHATAWSLDEFASQDVFASVDASSSGGTPAMESMEADFAVRLAAERARAEADAYARGRADGERAARATLDDTVASAMSALHEAVQSVRLHEARWLTNVEENIAALAVMVASHVVQREVVVDPSFLNALVTNAIAQYPQDQEISIRLCPEDLAACRAVIAEQYDGSRNLRWMADPAIARGGCLTEGRERIIDGRVDVALERAYRAIAGVQA
jgi:flagellar biosynthesis/type III secretory pathway protein FliH